MSIQDKIRKIAVMIYSVIILGLTALFFVFPKEDFSQNENRYLAKFPELSRKTYVSGEYMDLLSDWLSDHFPMRDKFMGYKSAFEIATGRREIGGVYIAKDDYLIEAYDAPVNTQRICDTFRKFYKKTDKSKVDTKLMLIPTAVTIYDDKLPALAPKGDQTATAKEIYDRTGIPSIDCSRKLYEAASSGQLYYRTDHHWTTFGAYQGYAAYCEAKGLAAVSLEEFSAQKVTDEFAGTLYSKVNDYHHVKDDIVVYTHPDDQLTVTYMDTGEVTDSLYNMEYLAEKDKYSLFLNNIHTLVEIENANAQSEDVLVLIKDSYANSMVPFLAHHYRKIYVFDTRYEKQGPSNFLAEHSEVTDVLILYNMNTLDNDSGIRGIY